MWVQVRTQIHGLFSVGAVPFLFHGWYLWFEGGIRSKSWPDWLIFHSIIYSKPNHTKFVSASYSGARESKDSTPWHRLLECVIFYCGIFIATKCQGVMRFQSVSWLDNGFVSLQGQMILLTIASRLAHTSSIQWKTGWGGCWHDSIAEEVLYADLSTSPGAEVKMSGAILLLHDMDVDNFTFHHSFRGTGQNTRRSSKT